MFNNFEFIMLEFAIFLLDIFVHENSLYKFYIKTNLKNFLIVSKLELVDPISKY